MGYQRKSLYSAGFFLFLRVFVLNTLIFQLFEQFAIIRLIRWMVAHNADFFFSTWQHPLFSRTKPVRYFPAFYFKPHNICSICSFCFLNEYCADLFSVHCLRKQQSWSQLRLHNDASDLITLLCICVCCAVAQNSLEELIFLSNFPDAPAFSQIQPKLTFSASIIKRQSDHK